MYSEDIRNKSLCAVSKPHVVFGENRKKFFFPMGGDNINIIFLDIDGVLNSMAYFKSLGKRNAYPSNEHREISDYHLQMLAKIYHTCHASIVLSSTWRELDDSENIECYAMCKYLVDSLAKYNMRIMSKTPIINQNRPLEIVTWLNRNKENGKIKFVSLDDDFNEKDYERYGIKNCLIKTKFYCDDIREGGLQQKHVNRAIEILIK